MAEANRLHRIYDSTNFSVVVKQAISGCCDQGIHLWRLNSDNYPYEGHVQKQVYDFLHGTSAVSATAVTSPPGN